ncbi:MAG: hypothetical protein SPF04_00735 [Bacilli bacterium]|nr:hypothetical protein [Bacilli bacterium]
MTKLGRKGFMLAEVVVVSAVISTVLVTMYIAINRVSSAYETRNSYYDIDALFFAEEINDLIKDKELQADSNSKLLLGDLYTAYQSLGYKANGYYITPSTLNNTIEGKQTLKDFMSYLKTKLSNDNNYTYIIVSELCTPDDDCRYYALKVKVGDNNG